MKREAFTMIELIFVIVILGILASVAIPTFTATRLDAEITKYASDVSTIRSSIATIRSRNLLEGNPAFPPLEGADGARLFDGVLDYPILPLEAGRRSGWTGDGVDYVLTIGGDEIDFTYDDTTGIFTCVIANPGDLCSQVTQ